MRLLTATLFASLVAAFSNNAAADDSYKIDGWIIDGEFPSEPRFPAAPTVSFQIHASVSPDDYQTALLRREPKVEKNSGGRAWKFSENIFGELSRTYIFFKIDLPGYTLAQAPGAGYAIRQIPPKSEIRNGEVPVEFELLRRSVIADAHRREATASLDKAVPGPNDFERANTSARKAIEIDPTIDNYLNLFDIIRKANRTGYPELSADLQSAAALELLPGYEGFNFEQQWRLQSELLMTLVRMPDLDAPIGFGGSVRDAAILVGQDMVGQLVDGENYSKLPVIEVFRALARLHTENGDCPSLISNNARALDLSDEVAMSWSSRRLFLLEWVDCLLLRSGIGNGRSEEAFISDTALSMVLSGEWARFMEAASAYEQDFAFPSSDADRRLFDEFERAQTITERAQAE